MHLKNFDTRTALNQKVSRKRIGHEIEKMLSGENPLSALTFLIDLHLYDIILRMPKDNIEGPYNADRLIHRLLPQMAILSFNLYL